MGTLCNLKPKVNPALTDFLETYPNAQTVKQNLWELLIAAMGSEHADMWDGKARAEKLFFHEQMGHFIDHFYKAIEA